MNANYIYIPSETEIIETIVNGNFKNIEKIMSRKNIYPVVRNGNLSLVRVFWPSSDTPDSDYMCVTKPIMVFSENMIEIIFYNENLMITKQAFTVESDYKEMLSLLDQWLTGITF